MSSVAAGHRQFIPKRPSSLRHAIIIEHDEKEEDYCSSTSSVPTLSSLSRTSSSSSLDSHYSIFDTDSISSTSSEFSIITNPATSPEEDPKSSADGVAQSTPTSIMGPDSTPKKASETSSSLEEEEESFPSLLEIYDSYYQNAPDYRVSSISCPTPPISYQPRPLTKQALKVEKEFHSKIRVMYIQAKLYEERIDEDDSASQFLRQDLRLLKKRLWEYHMREMNPAAPAPISSLVRIPASCEKSEFAQICIYSTLFLALVALCILIYKTLI